MRHYAFNFSRDLLFAIINEIAAGITGESNREYLA